MADPTTIAPPNYTQIPNMLFDLMADRDANLTDAELRVILAIARQTFGWHKKRDKISLSQLETLTSMSRQGVSNGLARAIARGIVKATPDLDDRRGGIFYCLIVDDDTSQPRRLVNDVDQSTGLTRTSQRRRPELVNDVDTQKKERKERKESPPTPTPSSSAMPIGGGGGSVSESTWEPTETSAWMQEEGFSKKAQQDLRSLDLAAARADFSRRRALGQGIGAIVLAWRDKPPTARAEHNPMDGPWSPSDFARVRAMLGIAEDEEEAA